MRERRRESRLKEKSGLTSDDASAAGPQQRWRTEEGRGREEERRGEKEERSWRAGEEEGQGARERSRSAAGFPVNGERRPRANVQSGQETTSRPRVDRALEPFPFSLPSSAFPRSSSFFVAKVKLLVPPLLAVLLMLALSPLSVSPFAASRSYDRSRVASSYRPPDAGQRLCCLGGYLAKGCGRPE